MTKFVDSVVSDDLAAEGVFTVALTCGVSNDGPALHRLINLVLTSDCRNESLVRWAGTLGQALDRDRALDRARALSEVGSGQSFSGEALEDSSVASTLCDYIGSVFELKPEPQWGEAVRTNLLPRIPELTDLFDEGLWAEVEEHCRGAKPTDSDCFFAGWQILADSTLYIFGHHDKQEESPFATIAKLTRDIDHPALQIAHCIRDLAYGDESRGGDLVAMVKSKDPAFRKIFEDALWIDPRPKRKSTRK